LLVGITHSVLGTRPSAAQYASNNGVYTLQDEAHLYGLDTAFNAGHTGTGQEIAVYELAPYNMSDITTFANCYGLHPTITNTNVDGGASGEADGEPTLDIQQIAGLAPGATIHVYEAPNDSVGPLDEYYQIANDDTSSVVSVSWGSCEAESDPHGEQAVFQQLAVQGQGVYAASGDSGSSDCSSNHNLAVDDPGSQPTVTSVGGVSVTTIDPLSQTVWNDGSGAGGGGVSTTWARPSWQVGPGIATVLGSAFRMVPDISALADPGDGMVTYFDRQCGCRRRHLHGLADSQRPGGGGRRSCSNTRLGSINPRLYAMASSGVGLVDVTTGKNNLFRQSLYSAGVGFDMASGLGTPNATTFLSGLCASAPSLATSTTTGASGTVTGGYQSVSITVRDGANVLRFGDTVSASAAQSGATHSSTRRRRRRTPTASRPSASRPRFPAPSR
jgi:kumamolisin